MREEKFSRLADYKAINKFNLYYLVYYYLTRDIKYSVGKYAKGELIDIGCGNKPYEKVFEGRITKYTGCDIIQSDLKKVDILCDATNIPLPSGSFDTAFSTQAIEHVANHQGVVNEAYRLLKPGSYFILSGPMCWPLHEEPYDYFRFTVHGFEYILKTAGFEITAVLPNGGMWAATGQTIINTFVNSKSKFFLLRIWRFIFFKLRAYWFINLIYKWLDKTDYNPINTLNYVIVARKN